MSSKPGSEPIADELPTLADVKTAAERIRGEAVRTPLVTSQLLDAITGGRVFLKPENLQRTGSFKFRGAHNAVQAQLNAAASGVVACSSGNHAQGVAEAAAIAGISATIVMPSDAPAAKKSRTTRGGATVVEYDRFTEDREAIAHEIATRDGALLIHPFDDAHVIAGQGTCGLEIGDDLESLNLTPDAMFVCTGGGGLLAGHTLALADRFPDLRMVAVEPEGFDDQRRSFEAGQRLGNDGAGRSICDAILTERPGRLSFAINRDRVRGMTVSDAEALDAVRFAAEELKLIVEPGGAVALAAILKEGRAGQLAGRTSVAVLSGGNIDPDMLSRALSG